MRACAERSYIFMANQNETAKRKKQIRKIEIRNPIMPEIGAEIQIGEIEEIVAVEEAQIGELIIPTITGQTMRTSH